MKARSVSLVVVLVLVNYLIISLLWSAVAQRNAPPPTPTRTPLPTFTPAKSALVYVTATRPPTSTPSPTPTQAPATATATAAPTDTPAPAGVTPAAGTVSLSPTATSGQTAVAAPAATPTPIVYVVQAGDMLLAIAVQFNVTVEEILAANDLATADMIFVGQQLIIPQPASASAATGTPAPSATSITPQPAATSFVYIVQANETLDEIAWRFGVTGEAIVKANGLGSADLIFVGQRLIIPGVGGTTTPTAQATGRFHIVQAGDTLIGIAEQYGITVDALLKANGLTDADFIFVGQSLIIP